MVTLIWRTDLHIADRGPRNRSDDWADALLAKLAEIGEIAAEVSADAVIDGGDFFHIKSPSKTSHELIQRIVDVHRDYPCPVYSCVGNHDCIYGDLTYLPQQPLGVLFATGVFQRLYDGHEAFIERDGVSVRVQGIPYHGAKYDWDRFTQLKKGPEDHLMVAAHVYAKPGPNGDMYGNEDVLGYETLKGSEASVAGFGHWHKDQGVWDCQGYPLILNVGSLSRGSLSEESRDRTPCVVILRFSKGGVSWERRPLNVKPFDEVFRVEEAGHQDVKGVNYDRFVEQLKQASYLHACETLEDRIRSLDLPAVVKDRALLYLE